MKPYTFLAGCLALVACGKAPRLQPDNTGVPVPLSVVNALGATAAGRVVLRIKARDIPDPATTGNVVAFPVREDSTGLIGRAIDLWAAGGVGALLEDGPATDYVCRSASHGYVIWPADSAIGRGSVTVDRGPQYFVGVHRLRASSVPPAFLPPHLTCPQIIMWGLVVTDTAGDTMDVEVEHRGGAPDYGNPCVAYVVGAEGDTVWIWAGGCE